MMSSKLYSEHPQVMWRPKQNSGSAMQKFMEHIRNKYQVEINDYWDLHKWSVENIPEIWAELWDFSGIIYSRSYTKVVDRDAKCGDIPKWFEGARLNYAENLLRYRDDHTALIVAGEDRLPKYVSYAKVYEESCLYGAALRKFGIKKGDLVACYMSNREEPIYAMIGASSIGALWSGALPLLGTQAAVNRLKQTKPKILFTVDRFKNDGEEREMLERVKEIANGLPSLEKVVIVPSTLKSRLKDISEIRNGCFLDEFLELGRNQDGSVPPLQFEQLPFDHPLFINYTSGTTGAPKPIIHGIGSLLTIYRDFGLHFCSTREDVHMSISPVGWASWNIFSSFLSLGVTLLLYEGVAYFVNPTYFWDMIDEFKISTLLLRPDVLDELEKRNYLPTPKHSLRSMRIIFSGASVVKPQNYDFVYQKIKPDVKFSSFYGCTEFMGASILFDDSLPIYKGELSTPSLGKETKIFNESGESVVGEIGEMVLTTPSPSLPLGLWGDKDFTEYRKKYCSQFPGHFTVGDLGLRTPVTKGFVVMGRSDDTLKPKGTRFGSAEIYNVVDTFEEVLESLCVSQYNTDRDERAVLFVKIRDGYEFNEDLVCRLRSAIANELTKKHVPEVILETKAIPRNLNGKKMEIVVKKIINSMPCNSETVVNPESLEYYRNIPELRGF